MTLWLHVTERCWEERLKEMVDDGILRFCAYGAETCPSTGTLHYQAYCSFKNARSLNKVRAMFEDCHVEPMEGSFKDNEIYCSKEGSFTKLGKEPKQGERNDLEDVKRKLDEGQYHMDIAEDPASFSVVAQHHRFFEKYEHHVRSKQMRLDRDKPMVYIRQGGSDSGKTRWLDEQFGELGWARMPNPTSSWWITPTVSRASVVLIDDVGPSKIPKIEEFLEWTDRYPVEFNSKGGFLWWKPKIIVFTSNVPWYEWWPKISPEHYAAIKRRIHRIDVVYKDRPTYSVFPNQEHGADEAQGEFPDDREQEEEDCQDSQSVSVRSEGEGETRSDGEEDDCEDV